MLAVIKILTLSLCLFGHMLIAKPNFIKAKVRNIENFQVSLIQTEDKTELEFRYPKFTAKYSPTYAMTYTSAKDNKTVQGSKREYYISKWRSGMRTQEVLVFSPKSDPMIVFRSSSQGEIDYQIIGKKIRVYRIDEEQNQEQIDWEMD